MIKIVFFLLALTALAFGFAWLADQPGSVSLSLAGQVYEVDLVVAIGFALALIVISMILWSVVRFVFRIPTLMSFTARMRRRNKGLAALSRGMIAASAGDAKTAARSARDAEKLMGDEPLALLLSAQAAQLAGDRAGAERVFRRMIEQPGTKLLGLRGMHVEARRRGDEAAAAEYARQAHEIAAVPWAGQAMLERHALSDDWKGALAIVETNLARKGVTRAEADRQRAVLKTAMAEQLRERDPAEALALSREAIKLAPDLSPASALAGSLLAQKGDLRRAGRILEAAWKRAPHPDIARAYVDLRHGDAAGDRLNRAKALSRLAVGHPESLLIVARSALEARQFDLARRTMSELIENGRRPTVRMCLMMADIEETEHGPTGLMREWLARASRAPRDPAWVADGMISDRWLPASPVTGHIDAFRWETPVERLAGAVEEAPPQIWPDPSIKPEPPEIAVTSKPFWSTSGSAAAIGSAGAAASTATVESAAEVESAATVAQNAPGPAAIVIESEPALPEKTGAEPAEQPQAAQSVEAPAPVAAPPAPAIIEAAAPKGPAELEPAAPATLPNTAPPDEKPPVAETETAVAVDPKPGLPEHIVTAPDDPGPESLTPPPAPPRKRGLFG